MARILGVHGIGKYRYHRRAGTQEAAATALAAEWERDLSGALPSGVQVRLEIAYYAHHLHRGTPQGPEDDPATLEPEAQELLVEWVEALAPVSIAQGPITARARQAAEWLTRNFGATARVFAIVFCREVHTYLSTPDSPRRALARRAVADAIEAHRPSILIAHSLGSVVAYETLWAHQEHDVDLLITIGSPLAMPGVVLPRLVPGPGGRPPRVRRWLNIADVGDIVAIPRSGLGAHFAGVERDITTTIGPLDFHTAGGYLRSADLIAAIQSSTSERSTL